MFRLAPTVVLGTIAAALGIWWLGQAYGIEQSRLLQFLVASALLIAGCIAFAIIAGLILGWLRCRLRGGQSRSSQAP